jgi:hypothetical protein
MSWFVFIFNDLRAGCLLGDIGGIVDRLLKEECHAPCTKEATHSSSDRVSLSEVVIDGSLALLRVSLNTNKTGHHIIHHS